MQKPERLRFAPSPTGDLHVGGARAALFNWLYARNTGGQFLLRIEDTDAERSTDEALQSILDSIQWLGLDWDEEPVRQSRRGDLYRAAVAKLLERCAAYPCYCTKEELEAERENARIEKLDYHYSGKCQNLTADDIAKNNAAGIPFTVRFRVPEGETTFEDMVHETKTFQNRVIGDFIIARADGSPVYLLGVAVDDADMGITLVMRGDDHVSNTPKQIMIMEALGYERPRFAHLPQVLGEDKKKLSKRHGAASVMEYKNMGFYPEAVVNFLALLGWNPGDDREKMSIDELIEAFSIENISKKSGVFDLKKLEWLNGMFLRERSNEELFEDVAPLYVECGYVAEEELESQRDYIMNVIELLKVRCRLITDFEEQGVYFFRDPETYDEKGVRKIFMKEGALEIIETLADVFDGMDSFGEEELEDAVRSLADEMSVGGGKLIHPTRLAVSGTTGGPGLFEMLAVIGKDRVVARMCRAASFIRSAEK